MTRAALVLAAVLLVARPAWAQAADAPAQTSEAFRVALGLYIGGQFTDATLTEYELGRGGYREVNPLFAGIQNRPLLFGIVKGAVTYESARAILGVHRRHPREAFVLAAVLAGVQAAVTWHNARLLR